MYNNKTWLRNTTKIVLLFFSFTLFSQGTLVKDWSTYFLTNEVKDVIHKIDNEGNIIVAATLDKIRPPFSYYDQFTTPGAFRPIPVSFGVEEVEIILCKFSPSGELIWCTLFGGSGRDFVSKLEIDVENNIYLCGFTSGSFQNIATLNAYNTFHNGIPGFLVKFSSSGERLWGTYIHGPVKSLALINDKIHLSGFVFTDRVTGDLALFQPPLLTTGCIICEEPGFFTDPSNAENNNKHGYYLRFTPEGVREYGTYLGRLSDVNLVANASVVYLYGSVSPMQGVFLQPTPQAHQTSFGGGNYDGYIIKLNTLTNSIEWKTLFGGEEDDFITTATLFDNDIYLGGITKSVTNIATATGFQTALSLTNTGEKTKDGFMVKFNTNGVREYASYYGGNEEESTFTFTKNGENILFAGETKSSGLATENIFQTNYQDLIIENQSLGSSLFGELTTNGTPLWTSYYNKVKISSLSKDEEENLYVIGSTTSDEGVATPNAYQPELNTYLPIGINSPFRFNMFITKFIPESLSVEEVKQNDFYIYPNPSNGSLHINTKSVLEKLTVYDLSGRKVFQTNATATIDETYSFEIPLKKGIYLIEIETQENKVITKKWVVE